jgi:hypothetical protein
MAFDENAADAILNEMDSPKRRVIEALQLSHGIVTSACEAAQIPRSTFYLWLNSDPVFKQAVEDTQDIALDFVEGKLMDQINNKDTTAMIFYLKCRGKKRGFVEKMEVDNKFPEGTKIVFEKAEASAGSQG